jgi:hypothetical protein
MMPSARLSAKLSISRRGLPVITIAADYAKIGTPTRPPPRHRITEVYSHVAGHIETRIQTALKQAWLDQDQPAQRKRPAVLDIHPESADLLAVGTTGFEPAPP